MGGLVTVVLDNARYQRNKVVQALAVELGIRLLFLPSYSPNLNLIERLWGFAKRRSVYGQYHANFASFLAAIRDHPGRHSHHPRERSGIPDDAEVPDVRGRITAGRVGYISRPSYAPAPT